MKNPYARIFPYFVVILFCSCQHQPRDLILLDESLVTIRKLPVSINSNLPELSPFLSANSDHLFFTRRRITDGINRMGNVLVSNLYFDTSANSTKYGEPREFFSCGGDTWVECFTIDTLNHAYFMMETLDTLRLPRYKHDIYSADFDSTGNLEWKALLPDVVDSNESSAPFISRDGNSLYYDVEEWQWTTRRRVRNIYVMNRVSDKDWSEPQNLGSGVNIKNTRGRPRLSPDGEYLFFSAPADLDKYRTRLDIYCSKRSEDGSWSAAYRLPGPINTDAGELDFLLAPSGKVFYFCADWEKEGDMNILEGTINDGLTFFDVFKFPSED